MTQTESLWNWQEAAEYLGTTPATIRVRCSRREIPHLKIGRSVRFRKADLDAWLNQQRVEVAAKLQPSTLQDQKSNNSGWRGTDG